MNRSESMPQRTSCQVTDVSAAIVRQRRCGLTLLELVVVLVVLVALAGIVVPMVGTTSYDAQQTTTRATLRTLQDVIMNRYWPDMDQVMNDGVQPIRGFPHPSSTDITAGRLNHPQLCFLFFQPTDSAATWNPTTRRGWNGPYLQSNTGRYVVNATLGFTTLFGIDVSHGATTDDPAVADAWGNPIIIQVPIITNDGILDDTTELQYARLVSAGQDGEIDTPSAVQMPTLSQRGDDIVQFLRIPDTGS